MANKENQNAVEMTDEEIIISARNKALQYYNILVNNSELNSNSSKRIEILEYWRQKIDRSIYLFPEIDELLNFLDSRRKVRLYDNNYDQNIKSINFYNFFDDFYVVYPSIGGDRLSVLHELEHHFVFKYFGIETRLHLFFGRNKDKSYTMIPGIIPIYYDDIGLSELRKITLLVVKAASQLSVGDKKILDGLQGSSNI